MWTYNNDELYHFGIPGMKWGIRRYQNSDGSLTNKGKKRYTVDDLKKGKKMADNVYNVVTDKNGNPIKNRDKKYKKMDLSKKSDQELRSKIERDNLEKRYTEIYGKETAVSKGKSIAFDILNEIGSGAIVVSSVLGAAILLKEFTKK